MEKTGVCVQIDACHARMLAMESQIQEMPLIGECKVNFADDIMVRELCEVMHSWRQGILVIRRVKVDTEVWAMSPYAIRNLKH